MVKSRFRSFYCTSNSKEFVGTQVFIPNKICLFLGFGGLVNYNYYSALRVSYSESDKIIQLAEYADPLCLRACLQKRGEGCVAVSYGPGTTCVLLNKKKSQLTVVESNRDYSYYELLDPGKCKSESIQYLLKDYIYKNTRQNYELSWLSFQEMAQNRQLIWALPYSPNELYKQYFEKWHKWCPKL